MPSLFVVKQGLLFATNYNRACFMFDHALHHDPIFDPHNVVSLAGRLPPDQLYSSVGSAAVAGGWDHGRESGRDAPELIRSIATTDSLVMLKSVDRDPEFGPVFRRVVAELADHVGSQLTDDLELGRATMLISSPRRITAYHLDAEVNYLLQIRGEKTIDIFDPTDRTLLSDAELEADYAGDYNAARFRSERQQDALAFRLVPGRAVHVPVNAPHWVRNDDHVSVSLSVNYDLPSNRRIASVYRLNHRLRRVGMRPQPPGTSRWKDWLKAATVAGASRARQLSRRLHL